MRISGVIILSATLLAAGVGVALAQSGSRVGPSGYIDMRDNSSSPVDNAVRTDPTLNSFGALGRPGSPKPPCNPMVAESPGGYRLNPALAPLSPTDRPDC